MWVGGGRDVDLRCRVVLAVEVPWTWRLSVEDSCKRAKYDEWTAGGQEKSLLFLAH